MACRVGVQEHLRQVASMTTKWMKNSVFCAVYVALF